MGLIKFEIMEERIGVLTFDNPKTLNAFDWEGVEELGEVIESIKKEKSIDCLIMTGAGEKAFIAGGDIATQLAFDVAKAFEWTSLGHPILRQIETLPFPVIGAINGYALGGGTEMALVCDILIAAEKAIFALPEVTLGIIPGYGGTQRLPRKIGMNKAKELILTGRRFDAMEAERIGLVNKVVPNDQLMEEAFALARSLVKISPTSLKMAKLSIDEGMQCDIDRGLQIEKGFFCDCFATQEQKRAMAAFLEKGSKKKKS